MRWSWRVLWGQAGICTSNVRTLVNGMQITLLRWRTHQVKVTEPQLRGGHLEEPVLISAEAPKLGDISLSVAWQKLLNHSEHKGLLPSLGGERARQAFPQSCPNNHDLARKIQTLKRNACFQGRTSLNYVPSPIPCWILVLALERGIIETQNRKKSLYFIKSFQSSKEKRIFFYHLAVDPLCQISLNNTVTLALGFHYHVRNYGEPSIFLFGRRLPIIYCLVWPWHPLKHSVSQKRES